MVIMETAGRASIRPAAFVFQTKGGLAWVEPSYADPYGAASPAAHEVSGAVTIVGDAIRVAAKGGAVDVLPYEPGEDADLVGGALEWFSGYMAESGIGFDEERARVRELCAL